MNFRILAALLAAGCAVLSAPACAEAEVDIASVERDVRVLSDDSMEGREAGTRGYAMAAGYLAGRFASLGLKPAGVDGTWFQPVPLRSYKRDPEAMAVTLIDAEGKQTQLTQWADFYATGNAEMERGTIEGPLVFVGYGLDIPGRDDFAGLDLEGKIAVRLYNTPASLGSEERAHYRSTQAQRLSERGAIGAILVNTPALANAYEWQELVDSARNATSMTWLDADGVPHSDAPNIKGSAVLSEEVSRRLMAMTPLAYDELAALEATDEARIPSFETGLRARIDFGSIIDTTSANNVIAMLPGSDPDLADEYVVMTAHLDHEGIQPTEEEGDDEIYNGALDNASGVASLLEVARLLSLDPPRRPVLFIGLTAEEKGLLGSEYNAANPTVPTGQVVVDLNLDMPIVTYDFTDIVALGAERSTVYPAVVAAAREHGLTLSPDPQPEQGLFTRSDQYSYVQQGIPAVNIDLGFANGGDEKQRAFLETNYHEASDEIELIDFAAMARFVALNLSIARNIANMDQRPVWNTGDFFGTLFGGPMAE